MSLTEYYKLNILEFTLLKYSIIITFKPLTPFCIAQQQFHENEYYSNITACAVTECPDGKQIPTLTTNVEKDQSH